MNKRDFETIKTIKTTIIIKTIIILTIKTLNDVLTHMVHVSYGLNAE